MIFTDTTTPLENIMKQLEGFDYEDSMSLLTAAQCKVTRKFVRDEFRRREVETLKATCPPELFSKLQEEFPYLTLC